MLAIGVLVGAAAALAAQTPDTVAVDPSADDPAQDAYLDETARRLVLGARAARDTARLSLDAYTALVRERMGLELPSPLGRNRPWLHSERAARVRWSRHEPTVVRVLGARLRDALTGTDAQSFAGLRPERFAADPLGDPFDFGFALFGRSPGVGVVTLSPLDPGSERHYRFRSGDTIAVQLGDGGTLQAIEVTAAPRYASIRLVSAIMWIDPETHGLARVAFRLAKPITHEFSWQIRREGRWRPGVRVAAGPLERRDSAVADPEPAPGPTLFDRVVNGALNGALPRVEMDISTVVANYVLWEGRHWLPRSATWRGHTVVSEGVTAASVAGPAVPVTIDWMLEVEDIRERGGQLSAGDPASPGARASPGAPESPGAPATAAEALRLWRTEGDSVGGDIETAGPGETITITPADRDALTTSDLLPPTVWEGDLDVDDAALDRLAAELATISPFGEGEGDLGPSPWIFDPPARTLRLLRYNPVERVSVGTRVQREFGWGRASLTARVGTARVEPPDVDLTVQRNRPGHRMLVSVYRSLRDAEPGERGARAPAPFVTGDAADFRWSHGAAIRFLPPTGERNWISLRLFAEQHADIATDATWNRIGAVVAWTPWWGGIEAGSFGGGGRASVRALAGDDPHTRAVAEGGLRIPLASRLWLALQAGTAHVWGDPAPQDLWRIGGSGQWLRGHAESVRGSRMHMARVDLQHPLGFLRPLRFLRVAAFGDWARVSGRDFYAAGAGLVFMDGLVRVDLARGLRRGGEGGPEVATRVHIRSDPF